MVLLGVGPGDTEAQGEWLARKLAGLRIFADDAGKMNLSVVDAGRGALVVSQFTLYGDCRKGRRPSFVGAAHPSLAAPLYERFCEQLAAAGVQQVERGIFAADMQVSLVNDGPVTLIVDTP
jgi:D-tyrosyl-tRNA(Tyr) deacylase